MDLSELPRLEEALHRAGLDPKVPTMLLAEVVLTYMAVERFVECTFPPGSPWLPERQQAVVLT